MNKKKNAKNYVTFAIIMVACIVSGYMFGAMAKNMQGGLDSIDYNKVANAIYIPSIVTFIVLIILMHGASVFCYIKARKKYNTIVDLEDEAFENEIFSVEMNLQKASFVSTIMLVVSFFMFPLIILCDETIHSIKSEVSYSGIIIAEACFFLSMALWMAINAMIVNLEKKINPEKRGNFFDIHFKKKWLGSMDEAELMKMARQAQKAYYAGIITGMILWVAALVAMLIFHTGIMPIFCITTMLLVMIVIGESSN